MQTFEHNDTWFDAELRRAVDEKKVDYTSVEAVLLRRMRESKSLGILSVLQLDEVPGGEQLDEVEQNLFAQISQYHEYDEPVNDCLRGDVDLSEHQWGRIKSKLYERLRPVVRLPQWEQQIMAPCTEPTLGHWEAMEMVLFDRINRADERQESWVQYESSEEPLTASLLESAELRLDEQIDAVDTKPLWEQVLATEEIIPYARWEHVEETLFERLEQQELLSIGKQPFWSIVRNYTSLMRGAGITAAALVLVTVSLFSLRNTLQGDEAAAPTLVYQLEGNAVESDAVDRIETQYAMIDGGGATLINAHGSIELQNDATVSLDKITENEARYRIDFASYSNTGTNGKVTFLVHPQKRRKAFQVQTTDYTIEVTGTYFRVDADLGGRASTRVLEGSVRISDSPLGDIVLHAGEYIQFDPSVDAYRVYNGGAILRREELNPLPAIEELLGYKVVLVHTSVPGAEVHIDGHFCGTTPIMLRQSADWHDLRVSRQGYVSVDTSVFLGETGRSFDFTFALTEVPYQPLTTVHSGVARENTGRPEKKKKEPVSPDKVARMMLKGKRLSGESAKAYNRARQAERSARWRKAIELYEKVLDDPDLTPLRREDALFSIAKLRVEHSGDTEAAKEAFLTYLALFPTGSFAGESWLRLAEIEFSTNPDNAIKYYLKYFEKFPRHPRIAELQHRVGVIYLQRKQYEKAIGMLEQALANLKSFEGDEQLTIARNLHRALIAEGQPRRAESVRMRYLASGTK